MTTVIPRIPIFLNNNHIIYKDQAFEKQSMIDYNNFDRKVKGFCGVHNLQCYLNTMAFVRSCSQYQETQQTMTTCAI